MVKYQNRLFLTFTAFAGVLSLGIDVVLAYHTGPDGKKKTSAPAGVTAGCIPPTSANFIELNNVRALIFTGGDMFWDIFGTSDARYEIPKGSGMHSMFLASLWLGGTDVNGQLRIAAQRYRNAGQLDFWTGPLDTITAEIDPTTCDQWDKHFIITRAEAQTHYAWYTDPSSFTDYVIPKSILEWPAHGDASKRQSYFLAPFCDVNGDGYYDPYKGDFPRYELGPCSDEFCNRSRNRQPKLFGDITYWYVFNDKGNIHTETNGDAIGLEVHAQTFQFATNDEINNMTFTNYIIINRSTFTLKDTYFGTNFDADVGCYLDDYAGCDVKRGLGYVYNGDADDETCGGAKGYGQNPPAIGVDFFEGPYMDTRLDSTNTDRPKGGCDASVNGLNFGDGIGDNERWGMRRLVYYCNPGTGGCTNDAISDPSTATDYYNFLKGIWKDNTLMVHGGNGHQSTCSGCLPTDFMFPDDTDPCYWGTKGVTPTVNPDNWTDQTAGNQPSDRRFVHSAGPFTLEPGAVNDITVGIVWARASSTDPFESVRLMQLADDKAQALFDNCFRVINGPDAPELTIQELDRELILYLSNPVSSNNYLEQYEEVDATIIRCDSVVGQYDSTYRFQGYQVFQLKDVSVSVADIMDVNKARLVAQVDIGDTVSKLVNYTFDQKMEADVPVLMVDGSNTGIVHSFQVTKDLFATGTDQKLVNFKTYYYLAVAYGYNQFTCGTTNPQNPVVLGNRKPYLAGRKDGFGRSIEAVSGIPHKPEVEAGGTQLNAKYGDSPEIRCQEGMGNGGMTVDLSGETVTEILNNGYATSVLYQTGKAPVNVKIIDPLAVGSGEYALYFSGIDDSATWTLVNRTGSALAQSIRLQPDIVNFHGDATALPSNARDGDRYISLVTAKGWTVNRIYEYIVSSGTWKEYIPIYGYAVWKEDHMNFYVYDGSSWAPYTAAWHSHQPISVRNEQIIPELGISVTLEQIIAPLKWRDIKSSNPDITPNIFGNLLYPGPYMNINLSPGGQVDWIPVKVDFDIDPTKAGVQSMPYPFPDNGFIEATLTFADNNKQWLTGISDDDSPYALNWIRSGVSQNDPVDEQYIDDKEVYETVLKGTWAPYRLCSQDTFGPTVSTGSLWYKNVQMGTIIHNLSSIDVIITADKSKWTRCVVLELEDEALYAEGNAPKLNVRRRWSVNKEGNSFDTTGLGLIKDSNDNFDSILVKNDSLLDIYNETNPSKPNYISPAGMSWFPGYAINVETGERLNMMFGEASGGTSGPNANDMRWNPTSSISSPLGELGMENGFGQPGQQLPDGGMIPFWGGGKHWIYVVGYNHTETNVVNKGYVYGSIYDGGKYIREKLYPPVTILNQWKVLKDVLWVGMPLMIKGYDITDPASIPTDATVRLRVRRPFERYAVGNTVTASPGNQGKLTPGETYFPGNGPALHNGATYGLGNTFIAVNDSFTVNDPNDTSLAPVTLVRTLNGGKPMFTFSLDKFTARTGVTDPVAKSALDLIGIVPNPYYGFSEYERSQLDNIVKIINLPVKCTVSIYTVNGVLIRRFNRDDNTTTYIDWDLKNTNKVPVASGIYIIHVSAPGIGERTLKWLGIIRPVDLDSF